MHIYVSLSLSIYLSIYIYMHLDFAHAFAFAPLVMNLVTLRRVGVLPVISHQATKEEFEAKQRV